MSFPDTNFTTGTTITSNWLNAVNDVCNNLVNNVKVFGAVGDGITDDSAAIVAASASGDTVFFPDGTYLISSNISPASMNWVGSGNAIIKFASYNAQLTSNGIAVNVENLKFQGPISSTQYTTGVTNADVKTAFDTPEYLDNSGAVYSGSDFTHTQIGSYWTLSLASLTGTTRRSIQSDYIALDSTSRYVVHVDATPFGSYGNFETVSILKYDSSNNYLGTYDPASSGENLCLTGAAKIKIRVTLYRTSNSSLTNPSTELRTDQFQFFKLTNDSATANLDTGYTSQTYWQIGSCSNSTINNCTFMNMDKSVLSIAGSKNIKVTNNTVKYCWGGFGSTNSSDVSFCNNNVDLRQLHTNGNLYNLKFIRHRCFGGTTSANVIVDNNICTGANWAIEFTPQVDLKSVITNNTIFAEICGVSIGHGKNAVINNNTIQIASGWPRYGIEIPGSHIDVDASHNSITFGGTCNSVGYGVSCSIESNWQRGTILSNKIISSLGVFASSGAKRSTQLTIKGNDITFSSNGIFAQYISVDISNNSFQKLGDMYIAYLYNATISGGLADSGIIKNNIINAGTEGAIYTNIFTITNIENNKIFANTVLPTLIRDANSGTTQIFSTTFSGTTPTSYYSKSGVGVFYSNNNRLINNTPVLLGTVDPKIYKTVSTTAVAGVHTIVFSVPTGSHLINVQTKVGGDNNNVVNGVFLLQSVDGDSYDMNVVNQIGTTAVSSGAPLVASATMTASYNVSTGNMTVTMTQSGGSTNPATSYIGITSLLT